MTVVLLLSDSYLRESYLRESTEESWTEMAEPLVELSRPGCESLDFKLTDINPSTVANVNAFRVSIAMATTNTEFQGLKLKTEVFGYREQFHQHSYSCTYIANHIEK